MKLFFDNVGKLAVVSGAGLPALISVKGLRSAGVLLTSIGVSQGVNLQIQPSLSNQIYVYSFGDNMGQMQLGGAAFIGDMCANNTPRAVDGFHGIHQFYATNRASRTVTPIVVTVGKTSYSGFLMGLNIRSGEAPQRLFTWQMTLAVLPNFGNLTNNQRNATTEQADADVDSGESGPTGGTYKAQSGEVGSPSLMRAATGVSEIADLAVSAASSALTPGFSPPGWFNG